MKRLGITLGLSILLLSPLASADATDRVFKAKCASCHGEDGKGHTKEGEKMKIGDMTSADWQKKVSDEDAWAHLAISGNELYVRQLNALAAYRWDATGERGKEP